MEQNSWFAEKLHELAKTQPDKNAIVYYRIKGKTQVYTFRELLQVVQAYAKRNSEIGIKCGDRVVTIIPLSMSAYINLLSLIYIGATFVPISEKMDGDEVKRIIRDANPSCVITTEEIFNYKLKDIPVLTVSDDLNRLALNNRPMEETADPDYDAMMILYSSGTTSEAKGVVIGYQEEINAFKNFDNAVPHNMERYLALYPVYHIGGVTSFLVCLLWRKMTVATMEEVSAIQLPNIFELYRPDLFIMVPAVITGIRQKIEGKLGKLLPVVNLCGQIRRRTGLNIGRYLFHSINEQAFGGKLKVIASGGGIIEPKTLHFFYSLGLDACDLYASTEGNAPIIINRGYEYYRGGCVNDFYPDIEYRIADADSDGVGEVLVKSNSIMKGYFHNEELTKKAFADGYFRTGDLGKIENGYLKILGRLKENVFLPNGEKVSITDAEKAIRSKLNKEVPIALVPIKTADSNCEVLHLCVVGTPESLDEELKEINQTIFSNYCFRRVHYVDELPVTDVGKVKRHVLAEMICSEQISIKHAVDSDSTESAGGSTDSLHDLIAGHTGILDMDSLSLFQLFVEIEETYGIEMPKTLQYIKTADDLEKFLKGSLKTQNKNSDYSKYPCVRTTRLEKKLIQTIKLIEKTEHVSVSGIENIPTDTNVIICSNHLSLIDPIRILAAFGMDYALNQKFTVLAYSWWKKTTLFRAIKAIPVKRFGERISAINKAQTCLRDGYDLIIFPKGHLKDDMFDLYEGVALMSRNCNVPVLPLHIKKYRGTVRITIGELLHIQEAETQSGFTKRIGEAIVSLSDYGEERN